MLYELGCGDGRVAIEAARRGARVVCIEGSPSLLAEAELAVRSAGLGDRVQLVQADLMQTDLRNATVVFMFLLPTLVYKLRHSLEQMVPGARVISR